MLMDLHEIFQKWLDRMRGKETTTLYYTAVVLNYWDRLRLISRFRKQIPKGWKVIAHHMTINLGKMEEGPEDPKHLGNRVLLSVQSIGQNDRVLAVGVKSAVDSDNEHPHVTIAVAPGASPKESNDLEEWTPLQPDEFMNIRGIIKEVPRQVAVEPGKEKIARDPSMPASNDPIEFVRKDMAGKPEMVIKMAMKGKFPTLSDEEINGYINQAKNSEAT